MFLWVGSLSQAKPGCIVYLVVRLPIFLRHRRLFSFPQNTMVMCNSMFPTVHQFSFHLRKQQMFRMKSMSRCENTGPCSQPVDPSTEEAVFCAVRNGFIIIYILDFRLSQICIKISIHPKQLMTVVCGSIYQNSFNMQKKPRDILVL